MTARAGEGPTGNTFDKYGSTNRLHRRLVGNFRSTLTAMIALAAPTSLLDVGCGEGVLTAEWAEALPGARLVGVDLDDPALDAEWSTRRRPNLDFHISEASSLPFASGEFDLVTCIETLEHIHNPERALEEMGRVAARWLLVSTPREPLWRILNLLRGSYARSFGNTPGHVNHWSRRGLEALLDRYGTIAETRAVLPWTIVLVRVR